MIQSLKRTLRPLLERLGLLTPYDPPNYRAVMFAALTRLKPSLQGQRVLEIGPKDGKDSERLASLQPETLVLMDIPANFTRNITSNAITPREHIPSWFHRLQLPGKSYKEGNILYLPPRELDALGQFDLIWCTGVLYHNPEPLRFIKRLFNLLRPGGLLILETSLTRHPVLKNFNCVELLWPKSQQCLRLGDDDNTLIPSLVTPDARQSLSIQSNVSHLPSRLAVLSWLEMTGFQDIMEIPIPIPDQTRLGLSARKETFSGYTYSNRGPTPSPYGIGDSL
ncbi:MAG: methyltransferase domain-containing protein [Magnetococcales bacterium]|nr:methyltransferase domain-containing protein [Magnetococcales bacterium]MBF0348461.1 methyltransferase domain-containing protein [Magnetococcales bacterium]MBF0632521.1 methyltransferase domain-containing protein [Magnetococcales bacterium]